jgi:hypothetical protein
MAKDREKDHLALYVAPDGSIQLDVRYDADTVWLTQQQMAELFQTSSKNIIIHLRNIYESDELDQGATGKDYLLVRRESSREVKRRIKHFNLDAIIETSTTKVVFGSEGGLFARDAGIPAGVWGPGSIDQAHKADEFITLEQLHACDRIMDHLLDRFCPCHSHQLETA